MLGTELMETLIKSSAPASCRERLNLSWCCHSHAGPGESCSTAGLHTGLCSELTGAESSGAGTLGTCWTGFVLQ